MSILFSLKPKKTFGEKAKNCFDCTDGWGFFQALICSMPPPLLIMAWHRNSRTGQKEVAMPVLVGGLDYPSEDSGMAFFLGSNNASNVINISAMIKNYFMEAPCAKLLT